MCVGGKKVLQFEALRFLLDLIVVQGRPNWTSWH